MKVHPLLWALVLTTATGCTSLPPAGFDGAKPTFDPIVFFTGLTQSWGVFENRAGDPSRRFTTSCRGHLDHGTLLLDQEFVYADGQRQQRHWRIRRTDAHHLEASANDVVGKGSGEFFGNAFRWEYEVALKPGNPAYNVHLKQWMYLQPDGRTMLNRAVITKFGVEIAQVTEEFRRD